MINHVKTFVKNHKKEIAIGAGIVSTCAVAYLYHKSVVHGKEIHAIQAFRSTKTGDVKLVIHYYNKTHETIDLLKDSNQF